MSHSSMPKVPVASLQAVGTGVLCAFFVSGTCGLIHEVAWTRLLRLIMGNTTFSITTVLCAFMGGLALGSYLGGRFIDSRKDPLRIFALLEGSIGIYCFLLPWMINGAEPIYRFLYQNTHTSFYVFSLVRFFFSGVILLIPATFMGATLPVLTRFLARSPARMGRSVGTLYAINTFGAVLGASISGFVLIPALGVTRTIYLASVFNLLVSATGFWLYWRTRDLVEQQPVPESPSPSPARLTKRKPRTKGKRTTADFPTPLRYGKGALIGMLWGYGLSGFAALVYEIAWTRALSLLIGSTVYAFSLMLTAFVLGIAIGSMVYSRFVDRVRNPMQALAIIQVGIGLSALLVVPFIGNLPFFVTGLISRLFESFWVLQLAEFGLILVIMLVPTLLMGAAFPLASRLFNQDSEQVGRSVGTVYGSNTIGNILGSFIGGFVLIPLIGIQNTIFFAVAANILVSCLFLMFAQGFSPITKSIITVTIVAATGIGIAAVPKWDAGQMSFGPFHEATRISKKTALSRSALKEMAAKSKVIFHKEGLTTTVTVKQISKSVRTLYINGKPDASSFSDLPSQELVAHIPLMFHPKPRTALVIGLASGISLGSAGLHPLEQIDCVEISPAMVDASRYFDEFNYRIMDDPRVNIIIADARNHLALTDKKYDVIISQPSNPYFAGIADLFTLEFFNLCRKRLTERGIMCTWVQSYNIDLKTFRSIVKTFSTIFPNMTLWRAGKSDCLLVGAKGPLSMNYGILKKRLKDMGISQDLKRIDIRSVPDFLVQLVMGPNNVTRFGDPAEIHTDDNALVEFSAPRAMTRTGYQWPLIEAIENFRDLDLSFLIPPDSNPAVFKELADIKAQSKQFITARGHVFQSHILRNRNQTQEASSELQKAVALNPADPMLKEFNAADHRRAFYLAKGGKIVQAIVLYQKMVQRVPGDEKAHYNLALLLKRQGRLHDALRHYKEAVRLKPDYVIAVYNVGEVSQQLGDLDAAFSAYQKALKLKPDLIPALNSLAWLFAVGPDQGRRDPIKAVRLAKKANKLSDHQDPYLLETLGVAYEAAGRQADAASTVRQALSLARKAGDNRLVQRLKSRLEHLK